MGAQHHGPRRVRPAVPQSDPSRRPHVVETYTGGAWRYAAMLPDRAAAVLVLRSLLPQYGVDALRLRDPVSEYERAREAAAEARREHPRRPSR